MKDREEIIMYTCYMCQINFQSKKCPKCGRKGTPIYEDQTVERPKNNSTDVNAFFDRRKNKD